MYISFWLDIWMDESSLIDRIKPNKEEFIKNQANIGEFINKSKM